MFLATELGYSMRGKPSTTCIHVLSKLWCINLVQRLLINFRCSENFGKLPQSRSATWWTNMIANIQCWSIYSKQALQAAEDWYDTNSSRLLPFPGSSLLWLPALAFPLPALLPHSSPKLRILQRADQNKWEERVSRKSRWAKTVSSWAGLYKF